jgi:hypothetical protein
MNVSRRTVFVAVAAQLALGAPSLAAQLSVDVAAAVHSTYDWRGVTLTNRPVVQPEVSVSVPLAAGALTFGAWANYEPAAYDGPAHLRSGGELVGPAVTASALSLAYGRPLGPVDVEAGGIVYRYPRSTGFAEEFNTGELYGSVSLEAVVTPELTVYYDVGRVRGAYLEGGVGHSLSGWTALPVSLRAVVGYSAGQAVSERDVAAYFERDGVTHAELSLGAELALRGFSFAPVVRYTFARDEWTRITAPERTRAAKLGVGLTVGWGWTAPER